MKQSLRKRVWTIGVWAPFAAAACAAPESPAVVPAPAHVADQPATRVEDPIAQVAQEAFTAWADGLPAESSLPQMSLSVDFVVAGRLDELSGQDFNFEGAPAPADLEFNMSMTMSGEIKDWTRFRARMDVNMDMGMLRRQSGGRPTVMGCDFVGDGDTLWIQPDWSNAWFIEDLRGQGMGIENMVFSVRMDTLRELFRAVPMAVPEDSRPIVQSMFECAANPACLARLLARSARVNSFERRGDRVLADMDFAPEFWGEAARMAQNPAFKLFGESGLRYRMEFDAATGANLRSESASASADGRTHFRYLTEVAARPYPPEHFRYQVPTTRKVFPVDVFMKPIIQQIRLEAGQPLDPTAGDFEF